MRYIPFISLAICAVTTLLSVPGLCLNASEIAETNNLQKVVSSIAATGWIADKARIFSQSGSLAAPQAVPQAQGQPPQNQAPANLGLLDLDDVDDERKAMLPEFRCSNVFQRKLQRGQRYITAEVFAFPTTDEAYAAYTTLRQGATTVVKRGGASSEHDQAISFWKNRYFVRVFATSVDDDESKDVVRTIANQLEAAIPGVPAEPPRMLSRLPYMDRVKGSERLVMGPISARRFFPAPYIGSVSFSNASAAAVADYQMQAPYPERLKLLCIDYKDSDAAFRAYDRYMSALQEVRRTDAGETPGVGGSNSALFKVNGSYLLCCCANGRLSIITGARKRQSPGAFARYLY